MCLSGHCCDFVTGLNPVPGTELGTADRLGILTHFVRHTFFMGVTPGLSIAGYVITKRVESNRILESWEGESIRNESSPIKSAHTCKGFFLFK